ncbi:type I-B CRISPR-associated protein Cas7/Cst2/DevR [Acetoanaerobium noterae]|uniref:type I-B CRISPR-associated protein Cas7/Cst2/DevR n=1 Tax=Acetoanaerobium noterae TaxID=745369 RepID=UPI0028AEB6D7|nr:type I-B CRISPR-associated protein Cas7/Cst2/DevR [Acetoanaerobium noterae]
MRPKGLAITIIFEAESANYGESIGNVASLKKMSRGKGDQYTYISRQALRHNVVEQLGERLAPVKAEGSGDKKVVQFESDATIVDYPELDFFGYLKTEKGGNGKKRSAKVRISNAVSLEPFRGDLDFLTNKGLADRINSNMNIAQAEIHRSYYRYTITIDLDQIGIDSPVPEENYEIDHKEKARRIEKLLDTVSLLYRDIRGRREDLKPLFAIGGVYDIKNPIFSNTVELKDGMLQVNQIKSVMYKGIKENTKCGLVMGKFINENEIKAELNAVNMPEFIESLKKDVRDYYEGN